jgi:predicted NBD/HSP70 family sugar kinase
MMKNPRAISTMRVAAASATTASERLRPRGSNQIGMREFNERVVLQALRLHGALSKAEIARLTHLTPQTISFIIGRLEKDGLVLRRAAVRGKVGQPSVPIALDPRGAYSIGVKIGRRSLDLLLVDFIGNVRERISSSYAFPDPDNLFKNIEAGIRKLRRRLGSKGSGRLQGIGLAAPLSLSGWHDVLGIPATKAKKWEGVDIRERVAALTELPVQFVKDTAAACVAELVAGGGRELRSFLYVFVGTFIGGGLVLDSRLHRGVSGNAGAVGSFATALGASGAMPDQLLGKASLWNLEMLYGQSGLNPQAALDGRALEEPWAKFTRRWLQTASGPMALAVHGAACLLDVDAVILDGAMSRPLLLALLQSVDQALDAGNWQGVSRPRLQQGTIGADARALGGALLPLYANFAPDHDLFLK